MRLRNGTAHDSVWLARIVATVTPPGLDDDTVVAFTTVRVLTGEGLAWARGTQSPGSVPQALIGVPLAPQFPQYPPPQTRARAKQKGWTVELRSLEEVLIYTVAHELGHLRGGPSERPAHAWGMRMVRRYRRRGLKQPLSR